MNRASLVPLFFALTALPVAVQAGVVTLDFGDATINARPSGVAAAPYLAANGVTITGISPGTTFSINDDRDIYNAPPDDNHDSVLAQSHHNFAWQTGSNDPVFVELTFATPVSEVSFYRIGSGGNAATPAWNAAVYNGTTALASVGEGINGFYLQPPKQFTFVAANYGAPYITKILFNSNNYHFAAYSSVGIDDLSFSPIPEFASLALCGAAASIFYGARRVLRRRGA